MWTRLIVSVTNVYEILGRPPVDNEHMLNRWGSITVDGASHHHHKYIYKGHFVNLVVVLIL